MSGATLEGRDRLNAAGGHISIADEVRDVAAHAHLLKCLVGRDLTVRYKRSILGFFWTMLNPLLMMVILTIVFSTIFRFAISHYETYFLSAYLPWIYFSQTTVGAMLGIAWNGPLMKRVRIPKSIFAVSAVISGMANLLLSLLPLAVIMLAVGAPLRPALLFLPVSLLILALFTLGVSLGLSIVAVYFADVKEMYQVGVMALMYLSPIFYPIEIVPEQFAWIVRLNPLLYLLRIVRDPIYAGRLPAASDLAISALWAAVAMLLGWLAFRRLAPEVYPHL